MFLIEKYELHSLGLHFGLVFKKGILMGKPTVLTENYSGKPVVMSDKVKS